MPACRMLLGPEEAVAVDDEDQIRVGLVRTRDEKSPCSLRRRGTARCTSKGPWRRRRSDPAALCRAARSRASAVKPVTNPCALPPRAGRGAAGVARSRGGNAVASQATCRRWEPCARGVRRRVARLMAKIGDGVGFGRCFGPGAPLGAEREHAEQARERQAACTATHPRCLSPTSSGQPLPEAQRQPQPAARQVGRVERRVKPEVGVEPTDDGPEPDVARVVIEKPQERGHERPAAGRARTAGLSDVTVS